jgi:plastocyanin
LRTHRSIAPKLAVVASLGLFGLAACGSPVKHTAAAATATTMPAITMPATTGDPGTAPPAGPAVAANAVTISNFAFLPATITVKSGTTVTWTNKDEEAHTVFSQAAAVKSPVLDPASGTYSHTFSTPGTYSYNCTIHPFMHGVVVVTA